MIDKRKLLFTLVVFVGLFSIIATKAFYLQVINRGKLIDYANSQFERKIKKFPPRGNIIDRNGQSIAINVPTYTLFTIPKLNPKKSIYKELANIVPELGYNKIISKIKNRKNYTVLAKSIKLSHSQVKQLKKIEGIYFEKEYTRFYPNHELLAQTVGYMGSENKGLSGLEMKFEKELKGEEVEVKYYRDAKGRPIKYDFEELESKSKDLVLTIDKDLQGTVESILKDAVEENKARKAGAGIMDATTGEILAIANYPSFDPNNSKKYSDHVKRLSFVTDPFEPGSVFKTLVVAAALEQHVAEPKTKFYCEKGKLKIGKHTISEAEAHEKFEWLTVEDILKNSSNIGTTKIAFAMGFPRLKKSLQHFGVGEKTGIEIPGESKGIVTSKDNVSQISLSNMSFGHGIAVTGIQMLSLYSAIANGGVYVKPHVVKDEETEIKEKRIMSSKTAEALEKMLVKAVEEGTGTNAVIPHFKIAGKTGTAQRVNENGRGYSGYIASFIGYPVNLPSKFVIFTYVDDPKNGVYYGNAVAAPIFKKIAQYMLYKNKEFEHVAETKTDKKDIETAKTNKNFEDTISVRQSKSTPLSSKSVPNFIGMDKMTANTIANEIGIILEHHGFGVVKEQSLQPGTPIDEGVKINLKYTPPQYE